MSEAERLCERIGLLADGRLVAEGTADELRLQANATNLDDVFIELTGEKLVDEERGSGGNMISRIQQTWAFFYRDWTLTKRYWSWVVVFTFYATVTAATVAFIGVAAGDSNLTLTLTIGALLWMFLSVLFNEIAMSMRLNGGKELWSTPSWRRCLDSFI